ncbi:cell division protein FtsL [Candidatus Blochmannia ocreatus (nom. nud.)]|uniref:Cell division protein FtsL n=1 Tax=Candidatus Blochmannia ocreatus (nom. nud.) TaxID=251538 RepID=A0ABY4SY67_9ENTR|nr:cell division protein FtsL [Candidatus Blochmannia ocreatus]URJ25218.1 cell division protein FtsL [Candidatus Blochmannia ocreatus]
MKTAKYNLVSIIYQDIRYFGVLQIFLLLSVLITAMLVVLVTYKTRCLIMHREALFLKKENLDTEWRNLILEEKILSHQRRIERIATDTLGMCYVKSMQNNILN